MNNGKIVKAVKIILLILVVIHIAIVSIAIAKVYDSGQIHAYIDFPATGELSGGNLVVDLEQVESGETVNENLIVFAGVNFSSSMYGGAAGSWVPFTRLPAQITVAGATLTINNFTGQSVDLTWSNQDLSLAKNVLARFELIRESNYLTGTTERVEISVTHRGTFTTLSSRYPYENVIGLNSSALYLEVSEYHPMLGINWWPALVLSLSLLGLLIIQKKWI